MQYEHYGIQPHTISGIMKTMEGQGERLDQKLERVEEKLRGTERKLDLILMHLENKGFLGQNSGDSVSRRLSFSRQSAVDRTAQD